MQLTEKKRPVRFAPPNIYVKRYDARMDIANNVTRDIKNMTSDLSKDILRSVSKMIGEPKEKR